MIIIHDTDADGLMAACLVAEATNEVVQCIGVTPSDFKVKARDLLLVKDKIVVVDLCPDEQLADEAYLFNGNIEIYDHHNTSKWLKDKPYGHHDINHSACGLVKSILFPRVEFDSESNHLLWLCDYIEDRDIWQFKLPETKAINAALASELILAPTQMRTAAYNMYNAIDETINFGKKLVRAQENSINKKLLEYNKNFLELKLGYVYDDSSTDENLLVPTINYTSSPSDLLHEAIKRFNLEVASSFFIVGSNVVVSLRADNKFDVSKLAKAYGGGGHKNAAGFTITLNELSRILK